MIGKNKQRKGYEACSGCGVCLLSCPVWHRTQTMSLTRKARAKAIQGGATYKEIANSIDMCLLCGACETACPEGIGLADLNIHQRRELNRSRTEYPFWYPDKKFAMDSHGGVSKAAALLLAGEGLRANQEVCESVMGLLQQKAETALSRDDGQDIARGMEAGLPVPQERIEGFISSLRPARTLIVAEGWLHRPLRKWLPGKKIIGLGESLLSSGYLSRRLGPEDLYVIESRGYHADHKRLVLFYDRLRRETGCQTNLDLQRTAFSTGASSLQGRKDIAAAGCIENAKHILRGRRVKRVVVEDLADLEPFRRAADIPVIHLGFLGSKEQTS
ncbi:MAG: 4Fe-4S dicluster domain-containing protein [Nitrospirota bacterium]|nr:4Fe-4S dicluster domain-containing protein [Nitrospirota bacterium]